MLILDWRTTTENILKEINKDRKLDIDKKTTNILVNSLKISLLTNLNNKPEDSELTLIMVWNNPESFISFKEKIKILLLNNIKLSFHHLKENQEGINNAINLIKRVKNSNSKVIIQLPINNNEIYQEINNINNEQDIDNIKWIPNKLWCTQSAILSLSQYIIESYSCKNITILWSEWFIGKWLLNWIKRQNHNIIDQKIEWIDPKNTNNYNKKNDIISLSDFIISASSNVVQLEENIKNKVNIIDCWFIRWKLWIRGSIQLNEKLIKKFNIFTPVPWGIWPMEMLFLILKLRNINEIETQNLLKKHISFINFWF